MLPHLHVDHQPPMPMLDPYRNRPSQYPVPEAEEFAIRILCASELIGPVIGKSGANVRHVEDRTGARIRVQELNKDASEERLIVISSKEVRCRWLFQLPSPYHINHHYSPHSLISYFLIQIPGDPVSPVIEALILLHSKVSAPSEKQHLVTRLVVPSKTVGCILGEGGKVITEMRRRIGAEIRVYSKADKPKYLSFDEELVQVIYI
jgi:poly(rC)-binding protein 2/3/4